MWVDHAGRQNVIGLLASADGSQEGIVYAAGLNQVTGLQTTLPCTILSKPLSSDWIQCTSEGHVGQGSPRVGCGAYAYKTIVYRGRVITGKHASPGVSRENPIRRAALPRRDNAVA